MSDIEQMAKAVTDLGNHVAAAVRLSNVLTGILKDGVRDDLDPMTRRVILRAAKAEHDAFRSEHFRGLLDSLNAVVNIADGMWQSEPIATEPSGPAPENVPPEEPDGNPSSPA